MSLFVTLNPEQMRWAREIGTRRAAEVVGNPRFGYEDRSSEESHQVGCMGELAAAIALGLEWPARVNTYRLLPDLDPFWEVRWSGNPKKTKSNPKDDPELIVLHVTGPPPAFEIVGYISAGWLQKNVPLTDPGNRGAPAHFIDASRISPIDENFHTTCAWFNHPERGWICAYCPRVYEGPVPNAGG